MSFLDRMPKPLKAPAHMGSGPSNDRGEEISEKEIERTANYEGNHTELMFTRLRHPAIKRQMAELIQKWRDNAALASFSSANITDVEIEIEKRIARVEFDTPISLDPNDGNAGLGENPLPTDREIISPFAKELELMAGEKPTVRQKSIVEAHEKGHVIRPYQNAFFDRYFGTGFDITKPKYTERLYENFKATPNMSNLNFEQFCAGMNRYLFSAPEIVERMAQLKNYFGMKADGDFTPAHLAYARNNYVEDTRFDNVMTQFLQAITPETEAEFLRLINTSGI